MNNVKVVDLGRMDYQAAWDYQEQLFSAKLQLKSANRDLPTEEQHLISHELLFVEHPHVYTLGKSGKPEHLLLDEAGLKAAEATYFKINRGGDITYHGPGQLVVYPILDLEQFKTDIHWYMRSLEEAVIQTIAEWGIQGGRYTGFTGVWLDAEDEAKARKICAMGVRTSRWITMHGIALNVNTDMGYFKHIVPCGIDDKAVASMATEIGERVSMEAVKGRFQQAFSQVFGAELS
ncbi:MAG: lipoyl(octanoyl) transferase LipB [Sphingobacteriaceae bacterium]|nr:lipoyl(octanoyl) transferase LipB [Sphingobacteriaceae bacterium]